MAQFIKITDTNKQTHYININYIMQFHACGAHLAGNTIIKTSFDVIQTQLKVEDVMKLIEKARK